MHFISLLLTPKRSPARRTRARHLKPCRSGNVERFPEQRCLLLLVAVVGASRRAGRFRPENSLKWKPSQKVIQKLHAQITPRTHILRFLLHPNGKGAIGII